MQRKDLKALLKPEYAKSISFKQGVIIFGGKTFSFDGEQPEDGRRAIPSTLRTNPPLRRFLEETCAGRLPFGIGLDFGCGTGRTIEIFDGLVKEQLGIELNFRNLRKYRTSKLWQRRKPLLFNSKGGLPFKDGSLDFISSITVYEHLPDAAFYSAEFYRVLKPGGVLFCVNDAWFYEKLARLRIPSLAKADASHINMITPDRMEQELTEAGFRTLRKAYLPWYRKGIRLTWKPLNWLATKGMVIMEKPR